jgi:hypothetical protein
MIKLIDVLLQLRRELRFAIEAAEYDGPQFDLGTITFEVMVGVSQDAAGGLRFWVNEVDGDAEAHTTQRLTLMLQPMSVGAAGRTRVSISEEFGDG